MPKRSGQTAIIFLVLLVGLVSAAANVLLFSDALADLQNQSHPTMLDAAREAYQQQRVRFLNFVGVPLGAALILALTILARQAQERALERVELPAEADEEAPPRTPSHASALRLLALLQQEGRLIDFLEESLDPYSDAQVGAAARQIHTGCRKALHERMSLARIHEAEEGETVDVPEGFDPARIRLTGNVRGKPPFRGTLQHGGWQAGEVRLPEPTADLDPTILAPAEVEVE